MVSAETVLIVFVLQTTPTYSMTMNRQQKQQIETTIKPLHINKTTTTHMKQTKTTIEQQHNDNKTITIQHKQKQCFCYLNQMG